MRKILILLPVYCLFFSLFGEVQHQELKKNILVFYSGGGGGHISGCEAIKIYFKDTYNVIGVNLLKEVLYSLDPVRKLTFHQSDAEGLYNRLLRGQWHWLTNQLAHFGESVSRSKRKKIESLLTNFFAQTKPDLVISIMPIFNESLKRVTWKMNIPFIILSVDLDTSNYILHLRPPYPPHFCYCIVHDDIEILKKIAPAKMNPEQVANIGFPLRPDFFEKKDKEQLSKKFGFPENKPRIMIMMGANGSSHVIRYVKKLVRLKKSAHLVVCIGRNENLRKRLEHIKLPSHLSMSIIGFTDRVSDIMAVCDLIITKPGPTSIFESIESKLPIILDCVSSTLYWERLNIDFVLKYQLGKKITSFYQICSVVTELLDKICREGIKQRMACFSSKNYFVKLHKIIQSFFSMEKPTPQTTMEEKIGCTKRLKLANSFG